MNAVQRKVICAYKQMFAALMVIALVVGMIPLASMTALANTQEILTIVCGEEKLLRPMDRKQFSLLYQKLMVYMHFILTTILWTLMGVF